MVAFNLSDSSEPLISKMSGGRKAEIESNIVRCPDPEYAEKMIADIDAVRVRGDSVGGVVTCIVRNAPRGLGSPVFDKLEAELVKAALLLPATKGFEFGSGFAGTFMTGSEHNDEFFIENGRIRTRTNRSGGIQGGISNGEIINMRIGFKPTSTISKKQQTVIREKEETDLIARGRHDLCVVPRVMTNDSHGHSPTGLLCNAGAGAAAGASIDCNLMERAVIMVKDVTPKIPHPWTVKVTIADKTSARDARNSPKKFQRLVLVQQSICTSENDVDE